jgi:DNA modification methylase
LSWEIHTGDCIEEMRKLEEGSVDAVVCDPPYGIGFMGHEWDQPGEHGPVYADGKGVEMQSGRKRVSQPNTTVSFGGDPHPAMEAGRYDLSLTANRRYQAWCEAWAREAFRVLKPGGHLLASCGSRTYHRLAAGVEDAGFEIRDETSSLLDGETPLRQFVESLSPAQRDAFERLAGEQHSVGPLLWIYASGFPKSLDVSKAIDKAAGVEREVLGESVHSRNRAASSYQADDSAHGYIGRPEGQRFETAPATPEATQWEGWGTALKPAHEPIVVARKPLAGTVAENVLQHGTGGLHIDACRIGHAGDDDLAASLAKNPGRDDRVTSGTYGADRPQQSVNLDGRWPANVVLSEEAAAELDAQSGERPSSGGAAFRGRLGYQGVGANRGSGEPIGYGDTGGASRFFYCAKTSRAEREAGLDGFALRTADPYGEHRGRRMEDKSRFDGEPAKVGRNHHPTVKPINLMRWLVRLVTPPGGTVLDPFLGSGSTGCAAVLEGFDFIGIEREEEYLEIAEARIAFWAQHEGREVGEVLSLSRKATAAAKRHQEADQLGLELA